MGYLAYFIAGLMELLGGSSKTFDQGFDHFLSTAVDINWILLWISVAIWALFVLVPLLFRGKRFLSGAFGVVLLWLPLWHLAIWWLNTVMAGAYEPEGITDPVKFWAALAFTLLLGSG